MKTGRAILAGALVWIMIFILFTIMSFIPDIKDSELQQNIAVFIFLIPFASFGTAFYYKKSDKNSNGFMLGVIMVATGLALDAMITVPLIIIPHGGSYASFFTSPYLAITVMEMIVIVFLYWKTKTSSLS